MGKTVVAFGAHQDDIELRAGGTIAKYVQMGYDVIYVAVIDSVYVDNNYKPDHKLISELTHEDILTLRENESRQAAHILKTSEPVFLHFKPSYYWNHDAKTSSRVHFNDDEDDLIEKMKSHKGKYFVLQAARSTECVDEIAEFIKSYDPEIVLTQQPNDLHLEHYSVSSLAFVACRQLINNGENFKLYAWEMGSFGRIIRFCPDVIIDISDTFDTKIAAMKPFISQLPQDDQKMHERYITASALYWGKQINTTYAEPFSEMLIHGPTGGFNLNEKDFDYGSTLQNTIRQEF